MTHNTKNENHSSNTNDDSIFSKFFYDSADLFCVVSIDGKFLEINPAWYKSLGYKKEDLIEKSFVDYLHPDDVENTIVEFKKQIEGKEILSFVNRYKTAAGNYFWFDWKGKINTSDQKIYAIARDVSVQKDLEEKLLLEETKYRSLTESTDDLIMRFDRNYKHLFVNSAVEKVFGIKKEEFLGKDHQELGFREEEYTYWDARIEEVFVSGKPINEVAAIENGTIFNDWSLIPEFNNEGKVVSVLSYSRDITKIMTAQRHLEESKNELKVLNDEKNKFFSIISHDLRNPFIGFLGMTDILVNDLPNLDKEEIQFIASNMNKSAKQLFELLGNLLDWSCMQSGVYNFEPVLLNISEHLDNVLITMKDSFTSKEISVTKNYQTNAVIKADKNMFNGALRNIISNAFKFTPRGGKIEISLTQNTNNMAEIAIKDSGIGMPSYMLENLFSISKKINRNGTESEKSSGLGLIMIKEYVDKNNGKIKVESTENKGTTFTLQFPIAN